MSMGEGPSAEHPLLDASIRLDKLPVDGRTLEINADEAERAAIAARMKVDAVTQFTAKAIARPVRSGLQIAGKLEAEIVQPCVVTFVPVTSQISQDFERIFLPLSQMTDAPKPGSEVFVDLEGDDLPDYFDGPNVDLTELLMEILALNIDPFPRAEGAELPENADDAPEEQTSPFAVLEQLKKSGD